MVLTLVRSFGSAYIMILLSIRENNDPNFCQFVTHNTSHGTHYTSTHPVSTKIEDGTLKIGVLVVTTVLLNITGNKLNSRSSFGRILSQSSVTNLASFLNVSWALIKLDQPTYWEIIHENWWVTKATCLFLIRECNLGS